MHPYGPNVPRAGLAPGAAAALEQARRRQDAKNRRRFASHLVTTFFKNIKCLSAAYQDISFSCIQCNAGFNCHTI